MKGFKNFISKGSALELAIGAVVAIAFTAIVSAVTKDIIEPVLNYIGKPDVKGFGFYLSHNRPNTFVDVGDIINAVITFFITSLAVYLIFVLPLIKFRERRGIKQEAFVNVQSEQLATLKKILEAVSPETPASPTDL